jgi:acyl transferase domain-containing protein/acyl-CoA synthetase (AMP-forming)/AMP-acid ligase II/acyl carrier protein
METFVDVVRRHARQRAARIAYTFLPDGESSAQTLTYAQLDARARSLAATLLDHGAVGQPVLVLCPAGLDYVVALVGCFYAGAIAVPAYPPTRVSLARTLPRVLAMYEDCRPDVAIVTSTVGAVLASLPERQQALARLRLVLADELCEADLEVQRTLQPETPALLQYTSGSTARPKGVLLTHAQILANHEMSRASGHMSADDVFMSWLPPYHDMGLIGGILMPLYLGAHAVLMPPEAFIRKPKRWFTAARRHDATILMAPNFAFDLCVRRVPPEERRELDLSSWRLVYNGAEPIHAATLDAFVEAFEPCGFRPDMLYPCYGMAEATLIITGGDPRSAPIVRAYLADELERHRAVHAMSGTAPALRGGAASGIEAHETDSRSAGSTKLRRLVGCGRALLDEQILIVDPDLLCALPPGRVGEIWVKSRSVASGYWHQPELSEQNFRAYTADTREGPFLRTGDLGFFDRGELFITGRLKDLIIVRGLNHYPQDIERSVQGVHPALVVDAGAAFSIETKDGEQLVIVQEIDKRTGAHADELLSPIAQALRDQHDIAPVAITLIKRGTLLKTSSGKVQRRATKAAFLAGELQVVASWRPIGGIAPALRGGAMSMPARSDAPRRTGSREAEPRLRTTPPSQTQTRLGVRRREQLISDWLIDHLATKLRLDAGDIDPGEPLARYGVDSLIAAELTEELERWLGVDLPATISYDNPTITDLARVLADPGHERTGRPRRSTPELLAQSAGHADDPIAIVGMACRFPGAPDLASFWALLRDGRDAISEVPAERWNVNALYHPEPGTPGKMCSRHGGFVAGIDAFDAAFFGVGAREAAHMDPQQRLFLEVAWEALEDAGQSPTALAGSDAGVFAGVCTSDYAMLYGGDLQMIDGDYGTGAAPSIVANRLSYVLDLKGPSETIDSACSSALVALQHACQSLRNLDSELAIVGGVNAVLAPESNVYFSQLRALARDGRCKAFDARADGLVRSEGAGVIVLKRLSRARADGDRVYALVVGSSVNHDGRSNGLMAPSGIAQQEVVRRALAAARIRPGDLDYVEAHGVGTAVADAVELRSLGAIMAGRPADRPLLVGSVKTNVGHLEAASGMVSLIKVALALQHEEIPPHLHLREVHPDIDIGSLPLAIPTVRRAWRRGERARFAGVSAFGFGGTNAHVIVREPPLSPAARAQNDRTHHVLTLSAKSASALRAQVQRLSAHLAGERDASLADVCFTANVGRAHFGHRLALVCTSTGELRQRLAAWLLGSPAARAHAAEVKPGARLRLCFAFTDAEVVPGIARALHDVHAHFRESIDLCGEVLRPHLEHPLNDLLYGAKHGERRALLQRPSHAHAVLVALQCALHSLCRELGLEPTVVYGAGAGEYAAAAACGVMSWEQALVLAARRGLLLEGLAAGAEQKTSLRQLKVELAEIDYVPPTLPFVSASLGRAFTLDEVPDEAHWSKHLYHAPQHFDAGSALLAEGCELHLELAPPSPARGRPAPDTWLPTLAHGKDDWTRWLETLSVLHVRGAAIDWRALDAPFERRKVSLPTYPFERARYWLDFPDRTIEPSAPAVIEHPSSHPLLGRVRAYVSGRSGFIRKPGAGSEGTG